MCVCVSSFSVLAAAAFPLHTQEIPDLLGCCKKLSPLNRSLLSFVKPCGVLKSTFQNATLI